MLSEDLKIEIRPIPGRNGIKAFSDNLEYFSQAHIIAPFVNPSTLKYDSGLSKEDKEYLKENNFPYDTDENYTQGVAHPFWESHLVKTELRNTPMFLFPGKSLLDFVKWKYLLVNNYIYKSEKEMLTGSKTEATHYIYNEGEENKIKATAVEKRNKLARAVSEMSLARKREVILILLNENTDNKDDNYLTVRFEDILKNKETVYQLENLLAGSEEAISIKAEVKSAIHKNVLRRTSKGIFYFESNLGLSEEDVIEFLSDPSNQDILINIKSKIQ